MPMHDMNDSMPMVGDRIKIVPGHEHVKGHDVGTIRQVIGGALGIEFDGMEGMIHQWYVASEVAVIAGEHGEPGEEPKEPGDDVEMRRGRVQPQGAADQIATLRNKGIPMGKMRQFRRAIRNSVGKPLLFHARDGYGAVLRGLFERVARGDRVHDAEIHDVMADTRSEADVGDEPKRISIAAGPMLIPGGPGGKATALVPVRGVALYDLEFQPYCFSTLYLAQTMNALANDPEIGTIVLDIDSPGGMVTGTAEAADAIYAAGKRKKVVALVNPLAASAAYWLASQASEIVAIKSGDIGSIGVFMAHTDCSKFNEMQGMKITYIYAGEHKVEGNPDEPLADEAKAYFQSEVDAIYKDFLKAVARGRSKSVDDVLENFGKGRCMMAPAAKKVGMIDDFMTIDAALSRWGVGAMPATRGRRGDAETGSPALAVGWLTSAEARAADVAEIDRGNESARMTTLLDGVEPLIFRIEGDAGNRTTYADREWPKKAVIARSMPELATFGSGETPDEARINVENGSALYRKIGETASGDWVCEFVEGTFESRPLTIDPDSDFARAAQAESDVAAKQATEARARRLALLRA